MNWITMYGVSDIPPHMCGETCNTDPYSQEGFAQLWNVSPLRYIGNARTPTLIIHSDEDYRCPIGEGYQLFTALKYKGVPAKMVVFHGENHELSRSGKPKHRDKRLEEITKWFICKYLPYIVVTPSNATAPSFSLHYIRSSSASAIRERFLSRSVAVSFLSSFSATTIVAIISQAAR